MVLDWFGSVRAAFRCGVNFLWVKVKVLGSVKEIMFTGFVFLCGKLLHSAGPETWQLIHG